MPSNLSPPLQLDGNLLQSQMPSSDRTFHETKQSQHYPGFSFSYMQETAWQYKPDSLRAPEDSHLPPSTPLKSAQRHQSPISAPGSANRGKRASKLSIVLRSVVQSTIPGYFSTPYHASKAQPQEESADSAPRCTLPYTDVS